jgi:hypothetical protein
MMKTTMMKTTTKFLAMAFVILGSSLNVFSTDPSQSVYIKNLGEKIFVLYMSGGYPEESQVSIKNINGELIHNEVLKDNILYSKKFNLQQLASGHYFLELETTRTIERLPLLITKTGLSFLDEEKQITYKPFMRHNDKILDVMLLSPNMLPVEIIVSDQNSNVLLRDDIVQEMKIEKQYDFSTLTKGSYTVTITTQGRQYDYLMPVQ